MKKLNGSRMIVFAQYDLKRSWMLIAILFIVHLFTNAGVQSIAAIAPLLSMELSLSKAQIGLIVSFFYAGAALCALPGGSLIDNYGVKKILTLGQLVLAGAIILFSFFSSYCMLLLLFFAGGLGYSTLTPASSKAIIEWFPINFRGMAMSLKQTGVNVGGALAASILPVLAVGYGLGWRGAVLSCGILILFTTALTYFLYPGEKENLDPQRWSSEKQQYIEVIGNRKVLVLSILSFFLGASQFAFVTYLVIYFSEHLKISITLAGTLLMLAHLGGGLGRLVWGFISDVVFAGRRKPVIIIIMFISFLGFILMSFVTSTISYGIYAVLVSMLGFAIVGWNALYIVWLGETSGEKNAGKALGLGGTFIFAGSIFGTPIFGALVDFTGSFSVAYQAYAIMLGIIMLIIIVMKE